MSPRLLIFRFCVILILLLGILGGSQRPVQSAADMVIIVNSTEDINDFAPGNSICSANEVTGGPCTLRAAITEANLNIALANRNIIIKISPGEYNLTIPPDYSIVDPWYNLSGDLNINFVGVTNTNSITIEPLGGGPVVIRNTVEDRILNVDQHIRVIIKDLTMREGHAILDSDNSNGGGAIRNGGNLTLHGVALLSNTVSCRSGTSCGGAGGAIQNGSNLTIEDSTLDGNTALQAGAIWNSGNLTILNSSISNNHTSNSGTITNNATLTIYNSTFSSNSSLSTLSGIYNLGTLNMQSTTMANHGAINAIYNFKGDGKSAFLMDNIFKAEPGGKNCHIQTDSTWNSGGYNIANDASCQLNTTLMDLPSTDPMLGSFDYWGGPTKTIMLNPGSPAINHRPGTCQTMQFPIDYDQRYWPRDDGNCDTGAFEHHALTDVGATKVWIPSGLPESLIVGVSFQLYRKTSINTTPETVGNPVVVNSGSGWKATWPALPVTDLQGNPCTYFVREVNKPIDFITEDVDDLTVTNTYHGLLFLPLISK